MTTAYTSLLGLALPVTGELSGTWGDTVNNSITSLLDSAIAGTTTLSSDADVTLTTTTGASNTSRQAILLWTAGGTVTRNITAPAQSKIYTVINKSSSTQSIVLRGVGPTTGVTIVQGESAVCAWNGSDFIKISNTSGAGAFTTLSVTGVATFSAGTAALPAITTTGDTNTGIFFSAADTLNFSTGGAEKGRFSSNANGVFTVGTQSSVGTLGTDYGTLGAWGSAGGGLRIYRGTGAGAPIGTIYADGGGLFLSANEAQPMMFSTNSTERARIDSSGNLGIGTTSPAQRLNVATASGNCYTRVDRASQSTGQVGYQWGGGTSSTDWLVYLPASSNDLTFFGNSAERMRLDSSGNLGIGTSSPSTFGKLAVYGSGTAPVIGAFLGSNSPTTGATLADISFGARTDGTVTAIIRAIANDNGNGTDGQLTFFTADNTASAAASEKMRLDSSGNLRVGTTTGPASAKLVVAGGLSVNNNTDDATSVASYGNFFAKTTTVSPSVTTTIKNAIGSEAAMYLVSGSYSGASIRFFDIVVTMGAGLTPVVVSSGGINSPPARTYSSTSEQLGINFGGANTFIVLVTGMGSNEAS